MSEWQPIETAPKDGSQILVATDRNVKQVRWMISDAIEGGNDGE